MVKYDIILMSNGKWRLFYYISWFPWYKWTPTFGDGCGNNTYTPVEYDRAIDVLDWHYRNNSLQKRLKEL